MQRYHGSIRISQLAQPTKRNKKYSQNPQKMMSRQIDNHFDRDVHEKPWISLGIFPYDQMIKYQHSDTGLSYTNLKIKKLRTFQELWEKNEEIHSKSERHQGFREFREFKDISEEDVIVSIEYCTNCHEHLNSTKHDEARYQAYAQALKNEIIQRFPIVKVILKPLIYDHLDHGIDTMFLQRRLGCFEVQVISKQKGQIKQAVIGSKLNNNAWPQISVIINTLPQYFKKVSFNIDLKFADSDQKLKGINVKIQPYRPVLPRTQSIMLSTSRSHRILRPQSAQTTLSEKQGQSHRSQKEAEDNPQHRIERTNQDGRIALRNVPLDVYEVIIEETNDFLSKNYKIDLFSLHNNDLPLDQTIELQKQTNSCILVIVHCQLAPVTECRVEIVPIRGGKDAVLKESPSGSGKYEIIVEPDHFKIYVKKTGYLVYKDQITTSAGVCEFKFELTNARDQEEGYDPVQDALNKRRAAQSSSDLTVQKPRYLQPPSINLNQINLIQFQFIDMVYKNPVPNVYIKVEDQTNNKLYSYRSNERGICKALLQNKITKGKIFIQNVEYYDEIKEINEQYPLSLNTINYYYIIRKPQQSQLEVLIVNQPNEGFLNFYIILENKQVIQSDQDIEQPQQNPADGIQIIRFSNLQNKRDILQLVACLPKLKMDSVKEMYVLTPNQIQKYQLPKVPSEQGTLYPYFWILGSLKEPYEAFDVVNQIINTSQLKTYPNLTKSLKDQQEVVQCAFQSPNLIVAANRNGSVYVWNLDSYLVDCTINSVFFELVNTIIIWDDDNVLISDNSGLIVWLKKEDETQQFFIQTSLSINKKTNSMCRIGAEGIAVGTVVGQLVLVKVDLRQLRLSIDATILVVSSTQTVDPINKMVNITNDQIACLCDNSKSIFIYKIEKSLDQPLTGTLIQQLEIKGYLSGGQPILQIISLDQRYLIFGGLDGVLHTLGIDSLERGPNISLNSTQQVNSVLQNEDRVLIAQGSHISFATSLETVNELKITHQKYFKSPVELYLGECVSYEKRLLTFTNQGKMVVWSLQDPIFPSISTFLSNTEFPRQLKPNKTQFLLVDAQIPKESFSLFLINENGQIIKDSTQVVKFQREENYFYMEIDQTQQQGLWRLGAQLQNAEAIKSKQPKIYFITSDGFQVLNFPQSIAFKKNQSYQWLIGTLIPNVETLKFTSLCTDSQIVGKFPSLEMNKHEGKINQIVILNKDEFITAGEDKQIIIWNAKTFGINKVFTHEAEVLSIYVYNGMLLAGNKEGTVIGWKQHDGIWQMDIKFKYHEKGVYSIIYVDGSLVTASDDRKIHLVNFQSSAQEYIESVDRTFVISLVAYNKDSFAAGFPDGRVKIYKREKTGPKIQLKTLRTVTTVKVQHLYQISNNQLFIGGMDKVSDLINMDLGTKLKPLKDGHTGSILCSYLYCKHLITGGSDGRLSIWNTEKGQLIKALELIKEEIRGIYIVGRLLITASSNGSMKIWQEICPFIEQIPPEEEPEQQQQQQQQLQQ
ncbi:unnamed protein product (macronuclear) [Paramecium tetraurelia]|uniref:Uncharacterized protein n=1 Tax=Paramecium tetraurelia TaxID=5888 RepID=A0BTI2_PARTE|nr:uncharacterized protein GSPATT00032081001 [Paramecium tetraurelia]CAK61849.1 unnamed protein product [Paramecium tetraurelia]|eukprot:XP_001429247.1 hypothetical protein (macronuclear) [Paramecium tetraurelia strain d4-2]